MNAPEKQTRNTGGTQIRTTVGELLAALQDICDDDRALVLLACHLLSKARRPMEI